MPLREMQSPYDHQLGGQYEGLPVGCYCGKPAVQAWTAPNGSYGFFCEEHRHKYVTLAGKAVLVQIREQTQDLDKLEQQIKTMAEQDSAPLETCPACYGSGVSPDMDTRPDGKLYYPACEICGGSGKVKNGIPDE